MTDASPVRRYIEERREDELSEWDVLFASVQTPTSDTLTDESLGVPIHCQVRTSGRKSDAKTLLLGNRQRVASRGIERTGLTGQQRALAEKSYREHLKDEGRSVDGGSVDYPDRVYRENRTRPLLMIHLISIRTQDGGNLLSPPVVAWGISFPATQREEKRVEYLVNTTWLRENFSDEVDEEEMKGDDY